VGKIGEEFEEVLQTDGLWAAMRWLNSKVSYRFTAIFAFDGDTLRNVCLVDKQNPEITSCPDQPITESYCIYVQQTQDRFAVEQASKDHRVDGHPRQRSYQCYYGIPLVDSKGKMVGTVCHFDTDPTMVREDMVTALDDLAPQITDAAFPPAD
jgi:GAF domain-containing protein